MKISRFEGSAVRVSCAVLTGLCLAPAAAVAQQLSGLSFDLTIVSGDSGAQPATRSGRGWISGDRARFDLRGDSAAARQQGQAQGGNNMSIIVVPGSGSMPEMTLVDHDSKEFFRPGRVAEQMREMMSALPDRPRMALQLRNVKVDTLGPGEAVSGFATVRYRIIADIVISVTMMGQTQEQSIHTERLASYANALREFSDPFQRLSGFERMLSGVIGMDSTAAAEFARMNDLMPRGVALQSEDRITADFGFHKSVMSNVTTLSNVRRENFSASVFALPAGYMEKAGPM